MNRVVAGGIRDQKESSWGGNMFRNFSVVVILALLLSCGSEDKGNDASVNGVTDSEIVIGSHNDLSGPAALLGVDAINGARLRFDEINAAGGINGRKIRFVVEDAQYQVPKAIQAVNKLVHRDKIFAMFLGMGTPMNNAVMQTLFDAGIPNIFPISGARQMVEPLRPMMFTARGVYYDEIRAGVRYFVEERNARSICVMYQDTDYGIEILEGVQDQAAAMGIEIAAVSAHKPTDSEFTAAVLRVRNAGCDTVMMGTIYKDTILIFEAARKIGWDDVAFVGQNASYSKAVASAQSGAAEGLMPRARKCNTGTTVLPRGLAPSRVMPRSKVTATRMPWSLRSSGQGVNCPLTSCLKHWNPCRATKTSSVIG